jgi:protein gp37
MKDKSKITWTDWTWNIAVGCSKVDADCKFCYMYRQSLNATRYKPDQVTKTKGVFTLPLKLDKNTKSECWDGAPLVFTSSLTDFFHEDIDAFRNEAWDIIRKSPHLIFQILTKRPERINDHLPADWGEGWDNVWLGTSIGSQAAIDRLFALDRVKAKVRFLSLEPLHGEIDFMYPVELFPTGPQYCCGGFDCGCMGMPIDPPILHGLDWVIVGGESGNENGKYKYRECKLEWIERIVSDCQSLNIPVFVKQLGTHLAKKMKLKDRHAGDFTEFPQNLQIREFPKSK